MIEKAVEFASKFLSRKLAVTLAGLFTLQSGALDNPVQMAVTGLITVIYVIVQGKLDKGARFNGI